MRLTFVFDVCLGFSVLTGSNRYRPDGSVVRGPRMPPCLDSFWYTKRLATDNRLSSLFSRHEIRKEKGRARSVRSRMPMKQRNVVLRIYFFVLM
jgi:hypothetical protein